MTTFVSALEQIIPPVPSLVDGKKAQLIAHAATRCLQHGVAVTIED